MKIHNDKVPTIFAGSWENVKIFGYVKTKTTRLEFCPEDFRVST